MTGMNLGYARASTNDQDLTAKRNGLLTLGASGKQIFVDHDLTGTNRARPGLREAKAATRAGDTLVVTKINRLARSLPDARDIADELADKGVVPSLGGSTYDPTDPMGRLLFNVLGMVAAFEADLIRMRTREGTAVAKANGRLKGTQPKLTKTQQKHLRKLHDEGEHTQAEIADLFQVSRKTIHRELHAAPSEQPRQRAITNTAKERQSPQATP